MTAWSVLIVGFSPICVGLLGCSPPKPSNSVLAPSVSLDLPEDDPAYAYQDLIRLVVGWVAEGDPVGSELLIVERGEPIFHGSWGALDRERREPWTRDTICRVRSLTQPILATAILLLHERKVLSVDDPIAKHLPQFEEDRWGTIKIGQLLSHTAGLEHPGHLRALATYPRLCRVVNSIAKRGPTTQDVDPQQYSSAGYYILGCLITRITGMPVEEFLQQEIFAPLGMSDSYCSFSADEPWSNRVASSYTRSKSGLGFKRTWDNTLAPEIGFFRASGGVYSTVTDYSRLVQLWMNRGKNDGESLISRVLLGRAKLPPPGIAEEPGAHSFAWRLYDERSPSSKIPPAFGHPGGDESIVLASPELDLYMIYFTQSRGGHTVREFTDFVVDIFRGRATRNRDSPDVQAIKGFLK